MAKTINYRLMTELDIKSAVALTAEIFASREPLAAHIGLTAEQMAVFIGQLLQNGRCQYSWIAEENQRLVGVLISEALDAPHLDLPPEIEQAFQPIFSVLAMLSDQYLERLAIKPSQVFHQFMAAVDASYAGYHITENLINMSNSFAKSKGFHVSIAEVTGPISYHVFVKKCGFRELLSMNYSAITSGPESLFKNMSRAEKMVLVMKDL